MMTEEGEKMRATNVSQNPKEKTLSLRSKTDQTLKEQTKGKMLKSQTHTKQVKSLTLNIKCFANINNNEASKWKNKNKY